jgi:hypothetical protein
VNGVNPADFRLAATGLTGANITRINGADSVYIVVVETGDGTGTLRLDVVDNDTIRDGSGLPLGGEGAGNGNFSSGEMYDIEAAPPRLFSELFRSNGTNDGWVRESAEDSGQGGDTNAGRSSAWR